MTIYLGTVFSEHKTYKGKTVYWKIIGEKYNTFGSSSYYNERFSYPVIKCSKNGKEYSSRSGFSSNLIDAIIQEKFHDDGYSKFSLVKTGTNIGVKAKTVGKEIGIKKRRITYLENRIQRDTNELLRLKEYISKNS